MSAVEVTSRWYLLQQPERTNTRRMRTKAGGWGETRDTVQRNPRTTRARLRNSNFKASVDGFYIVILTSKIFLNTRPIWRGER